MEPVVPLAVPIGTVGAGKRETKVSPICTESIEWKGSRVTGKVEGSNPIKREKERPTKTNRLKQRRQKKASHFNLIRNLKTQLFRTKVERVIQGKRIEGSKASGSHWPGSITKHTQWAA